MGCRTAMVTLHLDNIALMPCNPAVGGVGKGQLTREVDALGGEQGRNTDRAFIQIKMLNTSKGPAVRALRAQADKRLYEDWMKVVLSRTPESRILVQGEAVALDVSRETIRAVRTRRRSPASSPRRGAGHRDLLAGKDRHRRSELRGGTGRRASRAASVAEPSRGRSGTRSLPVGHSAAHRRDHHRPGAHGSSDGRRDASVVLPLAGYRRHVGRCPAISRTPLPRLTRWWPSISISARSRAAPSAARVPGTAPPSTGS